MQEVPLRRASCRFGHQNVLEIAVIIYLKVTRMQGITLLSMVCVQKFLGVGFSTKDSACSPTALALQDLRIRRVQPSPSVQTISTRFRAHLTSVWLPPAMEESCHFQSLTLINGLHLQIPVAMEKVREIVTAEKRITKFFFKTIKDLWHIEIEKIITKNTHHSYWKNIKIHLFVSDPF